MLEKNLVFRIEEHELKKFKMICKQTGMKPSHAMRLFVESCISDGEYLLALIGKRARKKIRS